MKKINENFDIPYYIFEELIEYIELTNKGNCKKMKWENIKTLLSLAVNNNRLTNRQKEFLMNKYNRED